MIACDKAGFTITELAKRMGMSQQTLSSRLKTGKFTQEELEEMANILGCKYQSAFLFPDGEVIQ
jgi:DNA-binding helix-turn-helix protein